MNALVLIMMLLGSNLSEIPMTDVVPKVQFLSQVELVCEGWKIKPCNEIVANFVTNIKPNGVYNDETYTISLRLDWTPTTWKNFGVLLHEVVHHLQHMAGMKYSCNNLVEKAAYDTQIKLAKMLDISPWEDMGIDQFYYIEHSFCLRRRG